MAVIRPSSIVGEARGSIGVETFSRNQGGPYVKTRSGPGGVPTANQIAITDAMTALSRAWSDTLDEDERESWRTYAAQFPRPNQWGERSLHNGYTRFTAVNFPNYVFNSTIATNTAPAVPPFNAPDFTFTATTNPDQFTIPFPLINEPHGTHTLWVFAYIGLEQNVGVQYYQSPFHLLSRETQTPNAWKLNPLIITSTPPAYTTAKRIWLRMRVQCSNCFNISPLTNATAIFDA